MQEKTIIKKNKTINRFYIWGRGAKGILRNSIANWGATIVTLWLLNRVMTVAHLYDFWFTLSSVDFFWFQLIYPFNHDFHRLFSHDLLISDGTSCQASPQYGPARPYQRLATLQVVNAIVDMKNFGQLLAEKSEVQAGRMPTGCPWLPWSCHEGLENHVCSSYPMLSFFDVFWGEFWSIWTFVEH